jgi:23S rRNA (pseudouridine1915-N3)-methyltransferase
MRARLLAVGQRMPAWADEACADYAKRLRSGVLRIEVHAIAAGRRRDSEPPLRAIEDEGRRLLAAVQPAEYVVALDEGGRELSTRELADWLGARLAGGRDLALLIGGPDGHAPAVRERAEFRWSLSRLTLPHALARVVVAEQLYRAATLLAGHPYHRA